MSFDSLKEDIDSISINTNGDNHEYMSNNLISALAERIIFSSPNKKGMRNNVIIIGAGASVTAGIPGVSELGKILIGKISARIGVNIENGAKPFEIYSTMLKLGKFENCKKEFCVEEFPTNDNDVDWWKVYDHSFRRYFTQPNDVRELFTEIVDGTDGAINWSHLVIGELFRKGMFSTVLTTNFDQLALSGMVRSGVIPVVCDGLESLNRNDGTPKHPQLVEIHGSRHTYLLRNDRLDVLAVQNHPSAIAAIQSLFHHANLILVVGYGGREDGLMDLLLMASEIYRDKNIVWIAHGPRSESLSIKAEKFISFTKNSMVIDNQDADLFFLNLAKHLKIGTPTAIASPLDIASEWISGAKKAQLKNDDIRNEIELASDRINNLKRFDDKKGINSDVLFAASLRAKRMAGDLRGSYQLARSKLDKLQNFSQCSRAVLEEAAIAASDYGEMAEDTTVAELALELALFLAETASEEADRLRWYSLVGRSVTEIGNRDPKHVALRAAIPPLRKGLSGVQREKFPEAWARINANIGNYIFRTSGGDEEKISEADKIFDEVIKVAKQHDFFDILCKAYNSKANAIMFDARKSDDIDMYVRAVNMYKESLSSMNSADSPRDWAMVNINMAYALQAAFDASKELKYLDSAIEAARVAEKFYRETGISFGQKKAAESLKTMIKRREAL